MTTRRTLLMMTGGAALLTGCREPAGRPVAAAGTGVPDRLLVQCRRGLLAVDGPRTELLGSTAQLSPDAARAYAATFAGTDHTPGTDLERVVPATGARSPGSRLPGRWFPRAVSVDGRSCALTGAAPVPGGGPPAGRSGTALTVVDDAGTHTFRLAGVVEPDAFTRDGTGLFVLEWLPAGAPEQYRVRLLDLASGALQPLLTRVKTPVPAGAEEQMRGVGRQAVLSPDRATPYTLYTHQADHRHTRDLIAGRPGGVHAFVHVLHLEQHWAYCLDLPHPFGQGPAAGHALAVGRDGTRLYVADAASGSLAHADTGTLTLQRVSSIPAGPGSAALSVGPTGEVYVGAGRAVTVVSAATVAHRWTAPHDVADLGLNTDGARVYVGGDDRVSWLDARTGRLLGGVPVAGLTALRHVG